MNEKELIICLSKIGEIFGCNFYKEIYNFITGKKTVKALHNITRSLELCPNDLDYDDYINYYIPILNYFEHWLEMLENSLLSSDYDDSNELYPNNLYHYGFKTKRFIFIMGYTGVAGRYWETLIK